MVWLSDEIDSLKLAFGALSTNCVGGRTLIRVDATPLPRGCTPKQTAVLLVLEGEARRPQIFVSTEVRVPNGVTPRSTSTVLVEGEPWMQFS